MRAAPVRSRINRDLSGRDNTRRVDLGDEQHDTVDRNRSMVRILWATRWLFLPRCAQTWILYSAAAGKPNWVRQEHRRHSKLT